MDDMIEEMDWEIESKECGRWSQSCDNEDIADVFKANKVRENDYLTLDVFCVEIHLE